MSSVVVLQTYDRLWVGSDSAVSTRIGGETYRWHNNGQKLWVVDDSVIFCSGRAGLAEDIMREFQALPKRDLGTLHEVSTRLYGEYVKEHGEPPADQSEIYLTLLICKYEQERTVVYGLEPHNGFKLTVRVLNTPMDFAVWSGGIRVNESSTAAMSKFRETMNVVQTFQHAFNEIAYEGVGGDLTVYEIDKGTIKPFMHTQIKEKRDLKRLTAEIVQSELIRLTSDMVVAETVAGQLGSFVSMLIGDGNDITQINTHGIAAGHADFNSAPFRVNMKGDVVARSIKLTGEIEDSEIYASVFRAGQIIADTDIDVTRDARIGNNLYMGLAGAENDRRIEFVNSSGYQAYMSYMASDNSHQLKIRAGNDLRLSSGLYMSLEGMVITLNGDSYVGSNIPGNRIVTASELDALWSALAGKANASHSHSVTIPNHNHGNPANANSGGGTFGVS